MNNLSHAIDFPTLLAVSVCPFHFTKKASCTCCSLTAWPLPGSCWAQFVRAKFDIYTANR